MSQNRSRIDVRKLLKNEVVSDRLFGAPQSSLERQKDVSTKRVFGPLWDPKSDLEVILGDLRSQNNDFQDPKLVIFHPPEVVFETF